MSTTVQTQNPVLDHGRTPSSMEVRIYSHSGLFYWWPVWAIGYLLAALTYFQGTTVPFEWEGETTEVILHGNKNLGVIFTVVAILVIVMTNVAVRGVSSLTVIVGILAITLFFAYMGWWDDVFFAFRYLAMFMNLGFYIFFSTALFIIWAAAFFVFDRLNYWVFRPGQMVHHETFGAGEHTYDTMGMSVNKLRDDLFRHWILGLGSGDMLVSTSGAVRHEFKVSNVLFVGSKLSRIQHVIAMKPDETSGPNVVRVGTPD